MRWLQIRSWQEIAEQALKGHVITFYDSRMFSDSSDTVHRGPGLSSQVPAFSPRSVSPYTATKDRHTELLTWVLTLPEVHLHELAYAGKLQFQSVQLRGTEEVRMAKLGACSNCLSLLWILCVHILPCIAPCPLPLFLLRRRTLT